VKILFSPSEGKTPGGDRPPLHSGSLLFPDLYDLRMVPARRFREFVQTAPVGEREKIFGTGNDAAVARFSADIFALPTKKAVERYDGVAYDYLRYNTLSPEAQTYIDTHTVIFSNIFGPVEAGDLIPEYKFKQGSKLPDMPIEAYFKKHFSAALDAYLDGHEVIDLRAGFYEKFYTLKTPHLTFTFVKEGKIVSHWAKAYRGIVLKTLAEGGIETVDQLMKKTIPGLSLVDIKEIKNRRELLFAIKEA
jgi:hypothetical protein